MNNLVRKNVRSYIHTHMQEVIDLICTISSISSPTGHEETKAAWILSQLHKMGATEAYIDDAGNVLYPYQIPPTGKFPLYNAHIDTVFSQLDTIVPHIDGDCLYAPSCGDNSADVAALLCIARMLLTLHIPLPAGVMLAFNVGEEGLGNLKGIRHIMNTWHDRISEVVAVDGTADAFVNRAVGSHRYAVHIQAQGGHSWADFGNTNALAVAAEIIHDLYQLQLPAIPKTTYNIGTLTGGTTVNSIAAQADLTIDLRSESMSSLLKLDANIAAIIQRHTTPTVQITSTLIGDRPCSDAVLKSPLYDRIYTIRRAQGLATTWRAGSTDANIPLSMGIPATAFSIYRGQGAHTLNERLFLSSLKPGLLQLTALLLSEYYKL